VLGKVRAGVKGQISFSRALPQWPPGDLYVIATDDINLPEITKVVRR